MSSSIVPIFSFVVPAKAGTQLFPAIVASGTSAFAGVTGLGLEIEA